MIRFQKDEARLVYGSHIVTRTPLTASKSRWTFSCSCGWSQESVDAKVVEQHEADVVAANKAAHVANIEQRKNTPASEKLAEELKRRAPKRYTMEVPGRHGSKRIVKDAITEFQEQLSNAATAFDAFRWAGAAAEQAAEELVHARITDWLVNRPEAYANQVVKEIEKDLQKRVLNAAQYPSFSTSPMSNLMAQMELASIAKWLERVEGILDDTYTTAGGRLVKGEEV